MARHTRLFVTTAVAAVALGAAACQPAAETPAASGGTNTTHTIVETREVASPPVIIDRRSPDIVIQGDRPTGDSTTVRAGRNGIEVETTNR